MYHNVTLMTLFDLTEDVVQCAEQATHKNSSVNALNATHRLI